MIVLFKRRLACSPGLKFLSVAPKKGMRKIKYYLAMALIVATVFMLTSCGKKDKDQIIGVWEYNDTETGMKAVYDLKEDGTGTYSLKVGDQEVVYELKYEVKKGHLLVTYVNNDIFTEEDVFDSEFSFKDSNTMIIKDSDGLEMDFKRK